MKFPRLFFLVLVAFVLAGCAGITAYKTLYGVEVATTGAYDGYARLVVVGQLPTNDLPRVSKMFNAFQGSMQIAVAAAQGDKNALAPPTVVKQSSEIISLISTIRK